VELSFMGLDRAKVLYWPRRRKGRARLPIQTNSLAIPQLGEVFQMNAVIPPPIQDFHGIFELLAIGLCLGLALDGVTKNSAVRLKAVPSRHNVSLLPKSLHHGVFFKRMKAPFSPSRLCVLIKGTVFRGELLLGLKRHAIAKINLARLRSLPSDSSSLASRLLKCLCRVDKLGALSSFVCSSPFRSSAGTFRRLRDRRPAGVDSSLK
jgi:hypothetical protein